MSADPIHFSRIFAVAYHSARISWSEHFSYFYIKGGGIILFPFSYSLSVCSVQLDYKLSGGNPILLAFCGAQNNRAACGLQQS